MLRVFAAACVALLAAGSEVPCALVGKFYNDSSNESISSLPSYLGDAVACQALCKATTACKVFTFYRDSGGCWLQSDEAVLVENKNATQSVAGPKECPAKSITDADNASAGAGVLAREAPSLEAAPEAESSGGGGFPMWGWIAGGAVVALGAGATGMYVWDSEQTGKKGKSKTDKKNRGAKVEAAVADAASGAQAQGALPAGLPQLAPVPSISQPVAAAPQAVRQATPQFAPPIQQYYVQQPYMQVPQQQGYEHEMPPLTPGSYPTFSSFGALPAGAIPAQYMQVQQQAPLQAMYQQGYEQA